MSWKSTLSKNLNELRWGKKFNFVPATTSGSTFVRLLREAKESGKRPFDWKFGEICTKCYVVLLREFLFGNYVELKKANPKFPFLVREASQVEAKLIARYDFGTEASVSIEGKDSAAILQDLQKLVKQGESMPRSA